MASSGLVLANIFTPRYPELVEKLVIVDIAPVDYMAVA
jgi:hypothetical protein